jgi:hypothetical protein
MKKVNVISVITLLAVMAGCGGCKQSGNQSDDFITVDVTASYPKKELILQDFMDVEYIPLETNDDFVCQGFVQDIGRKFIIVRNRIQDGDIFIFDRNGKALRKINRKGQGGEEYTMILTITLDEDNGEMFVNDYDIRKIFVYDLNGNFKRSFKHKEGARYYSAKNFDRENLICYDGSSINKGQSFMIISKQDGSITKDIQIPFKEKKFAWLRIKDEASGMSYFLDPRTYYPLIPSLDKWLLIELSSDTIYSYSPDHTMTPFIVRTPPIQSMDPETFLFLSILTDRYYFMEAVKKEGDIAKQTEFPRIDLLYDKQEKALFKYKVYNDDYSNKREVSMKSIPVNGEIATWQPLEAYQLIESYEKGELKGILKEIASELDEDSNLVIRLIKQKK